MIEATNLSKRYGDTVAVDDLSFTVEAGHVTGFLGPNGSGKSTTMRMIVGLDAPTSGRVSVGGGAYGRSTSRCTRSAPVIAGPFLWSMSMDGSSPTSALVRLT